MFMQFFFFWLTILEFVFYINEFSRESKGDIYKAKVKTKFI